MKGELHDHSRRKVWEKDALVVLIKKCLAYEPENRPTATKALEKFESMTRAQTDSYQGMSRLFITLTACTLYKS